MRLYDTARQEVVEFRPGPVVTMYTCGITPYDATHVGHAATYLLYDVLQRRLRDAGHEIRCVRNVTDVDDDMLRRARELGVDYRSLAAGETARFRADMDALGVLRPFSEPEASSAIAEILQFVATLVERGHAYRSEGAVYFDAASFRRFGLLSRLSRDEMLALAVERGGNPGDPAKRDPLDFVLWQPSGAGEPSWDSPWGPGRPGWHVECSALAWRELGPTIDLHGGGTDLVFPHHECEVAQTESVTGQAFVGHWMHAPMVRLDGVKMSKSLGNLVFVSDLRAQVEPMAVRLAILDHSWRHDWDWDAALLDKARERLEAWRAAGPGDGALGDVRAALDEDLDLPATLEAIDGSVGAGRGVDQAAGLLGVRLGGGADGTG